MRVGGVAMQVEARHDFLVDIYERSVLYLIGKQIERQGHCPQIVATCCRQRSLIEVLIAQHGRSAFPVLSYGLCSLNVVHRTGADSSELRATFLAVEPAAQYDVDYTAYGVGSVDGRRPIGDYFNTVD